MHDKRHLEYKHTVLNKLSPSFCGAKWYNATIWLGSGRTTSCHHPPAHMVSVEEVNQNYKAIHNTAQKKEDRRMMKAGERPPGCEYCWKIEDMGVEKVSDRIYKSKTYTDAELQKAFETPVEEDIDLITLEIAFDRTCQFACSYCNPAFSTTWVKDIKNNGPYTGLESDGRGHFTHVHDRDQLYSYTETNPYIEAFFKWWEADLHKTLRELRLTGGEPLMSGHTWKLLDWFKENKNKSQTKFAINTNLGFERDVIDRFLSSIDGMEVNLYTSNEAMGSHAEYIRDGLNWEQWLNNVEYILQSRKIKELNLMCTINALCLDSLDKFLDLMLYLKRKYGSKRVYYSLNILRFPSFQGPLVLSDDLLQLYNNRLKEWQAKNAYNHLICEFEHHHLDRLINYLDEVKVPHGEGFNKEKAQKDFKKFYQQYDKRRNKDFEKTFSKEMVEWYESIKVDV